MQRFGNYIDRKLLIVKINLGLNCEFLKKDEML